MNQIYVWVKYGDSDAVRISCSSDEIVDGLKDLVKQRLSRLASVDSDLITLCSSAPAPDGTIVVTALRPGLSISSLTPNDDDHPLIVRVTSSPAVVPGSDARRAKNYIGSILANHPTFAQLLSHSPRTNYKYIAKCQTLSTDTSLGNISARGFAIYSN